ncbi:hypothetical protein [Celeribacter sp. ULVN23_4]
MSKRFILVADGPRFETPAMILVGSLRQFHPAEDVEIHACCPEEKLAELSPEFREAMAFFNAEIVGMPPLESAFASPYPHGNKLRAVALCGAQEAGAFFDTDTIAVESILPVLDGTSHVAVPEGVPTWGRDEQDWQPVYKHFGLAMPEGRVRMCRGKQVETLPYFNAGFVGWPKGSNLPELWIETALEIDHHLDIPNKRPWLDQIALPVAIARSGEGFECLPERYNFSLNRRDFPLQEPTSLIHYHLPGQFRSELRSLEVYKRIYKMLPADLAEVFRERSIPFLMPGRPKKRANFTPLVDLDDDVVKTGT